MVVDLGAGTATGGEGGGGGSMVISAVENFTLYGAGSLITGDAGANELRGGDGRFGGLANYNDTINGAGGNDTLFGGLGNDHFVFDQTPGAANADLITDFATNADKIHLDARVMSALGTTGAFSIADVRFYAASGASSGHDADDRVVYDTTTGNLWYDADGSGAGSAQLIATLQGAPALAATDLVVDNGSARGQMLNGTAGNDTITGGPGNDTINGFAGDDSLDGAGGADSINGGAGNDYLRGGVTSDRVGEGADTLIGGDGNDTLDGWGNSSSTRSDTDVETLDGGLGNDVFMVDNSGDVLLDAGGIDQVQVRVGGWTLGAGFENLVSSIKKTVSTSALVTNSTT
jgi:Ca2+-binding RTX toxin-like protein